MTSASIRLGSAEDPALGEAEFRAIAELMRAQTGVVLDEDARAMVVSRLTRRLRGLGVASFAAYIEALRGPGGTAERSAMIDALTTNTTRFFREPAHFDLLRDRILPDLVRKARAGGRVRLWSAACSSGEEAWSLASILDAGLPDAAALDVRILATDVNREMLDRATAAVYPDSALEDVPASHRARMFEPADAPGRWRIRAKLRDLVSVRFLNLMEPWPITGTFDVILCRNMAIYLDTPAQERLWARLIGVLAPGGALFIGHSERLGSANEARFEHLGHTAFRLRGGRGGPN